MIALHTDYVSLGQFGPSLYLLTQSQSQSSAANIDIIPKSSFTDHTLQNQTPIRTIKLFLTLQPVSQYIKIAQHL